MLFFDKFSNGNAQIILEKFEFFPVKCRIQRSVEIFSAKKDEILSKSSHKIKVLFIFSVSLCVVTKSDPFFAIFVWNITGNFLLDPSCKTACSLLGLKSRATAHSAV